MSVIVEHIKEHSALGVTPDPFAFVQPHVMTTGNNWKTLVPGAVMPFDIADPGGSIGDAGSSFTKMQPRFYPFVFPRNGTLDLINVGLTANAANNADRLKIGFWDMNGIFLFERNLDFTAGSNVWENIIHETGERLPRAVLVCVFPELQADNTAAATVSIAASSSQQTSSIASPDLFSASGDPTTSAAIPSAGFLLNEAVTRPVIFQNLNTNWSCTAGSGLNTLGWGSETFGGGAYPALRVSMNF